MNTGNIRALKDCISFIILGVDNQFESINKIKPEVMNLELAFDRLNKHLEACEVQVSKKISVEFVSTQFEFAYSCYKNKNIKEGNAVLVELSSKI